MHHIHGTYNIPLVILSVFISIFASYASLNIIDRVVLKQGRSRFLWILFGSCVEGLGIWSMHFVGMLAFHLTFEVTYDPWLLVLSMILPVCAAFIAMQFVSRENVTHFQTVLGGLFMGLAITTMHYTGMFAMIVPAEIHYDPYLVTLSLLIAVTVSIAALYLMYQYKKGSRKSPYLLRIAGSCMIGGAITSMHYTGMAAASFTVSEEMLQRSMEYPVVNNIDLAAWIGLTAVFILLLIISLQSIEHKIEMRLATLNERRYHYMFEHNPDIVCLFDVHGKLLQANSSMEKLTGYTVEEVRERTIPGMLDLRNRYKVISKFKKVSEGRSQSVEITLWHKNGSLLHLNTTIVPIFMHGEIVNIYAISKDVTAHRRAEAGLRREKDTAQKYLDVVGVMLLVLQADGTVSLINRTGCQILGYPAEQIIGVHWFEHFAADPSRDQFRLLLQRLIDGAQEMEESFESTIRTRTGERTILWHHTILLDDDENKRILVSGADITERKQAEIALQKSEASLSESQQIAKLGSWEWDLKRNEWNWSIGMYKIIGLDKDKLTLAHIVSLVHPEDRLQFQQKVEEALKNKSECTLEYKMLMPDQTIRYHYGEIHMEVDDRGTPARMYGFVQDITERKQLEMKLREVTQAKSSFLASMSHEIRTPLNAILGLGHLIQMTDLSDKQKDYIHKIQSASQSLLGIINNILDFSKIEAGKIELESIPFQLSRVLKEVTDVISVSAAEKGLHIFFSSEWDVPDELIGDPLRLGQVIINLANNAIKFTDSGEIVIRTKLVSLKHDSVKLQISVKDTGIGLTPEQKLVIFQSFAQANEATTRKYGGTGLGLSISQQLVEMMNGSIHVESRIGKGSTFSFTAEFGLQEQRERVLIPDKPYKLLVIDQSKTSQDCIRESLCPYTFEVTCLDDASSLDTGRIPLRQDVRTGYDLVLLDWNTDKSNCFAAAKVLGNSSEVSGIPSITMVNWFQRTDMDGNSNLPRPDYILEKPFNREELLAAVWKAIVPAKRGDAGEVQALSLTGPMEEGPNQTRILIAEDNQINRLVYQEIIAPYFNNVVLVGSGKEAADLFTRSPRLQFDIILMDLQMPEMDGFEAVRLIRSQDAEVPIIAITAHALLSVKQQCLEQGMNDFISKPIVPSQLISTIIKWTNGRLEEGYIKYGETAVSRYSPPNIPSLDSDLLDLGTLSGRLNGNQAKLYDLLMTFLKEHSEFIPQIRRYLAEEDYVSAGRLAHNLKGVAGNLSMDSLAHSVHQLEKALNRREGSKIRVQIEELRLLIDALTKKIEAWLQQVDDAMEMEPLVQKPGKVYITSLFRELDLLLSKNSMAAFEVSERIYKVLRGDPGIGKEARSLVHSIKQLDYSRARQILLEIEAGLLYQIPEDRVGFEIER
ncbi:PAS domain S-box protein [Paenibacillus sp. 32O-W]|uniref:PAS domain S-box protein n=1 Tax=Paenibacillus sp. 32O-W TaxID=1695218 RepID=UPI0016425849|nr:PAS domain S-box protein [Paenibacillus sp. 32O-W]